MASFRASLVVGVGLGFLVALVGCRDIQIDGRTEPGDLDIQTSATPTPRPDLFTAGLLGSVRGATFSSAGEFSQSQFLEAQTADEQDNIYLGLKLHNSPGTKKISKAIYKLLPTGTLDRQFKIEMNDPYVLAASDSVLYVGVNTEGVTCYVEMYDLTGKKLENQISTQTPECGAKGSIVQMQYFDKKLYVLTARKESSGRIFYNLIVYNSETRNKLQGWPQALGEDLNAFKVASDGRALVHAQSRMNCTAKLYSLDGTKADVFSFTTTNNNGCHDTVIDGQGKVTRAFVSSTSGNLMVVRPVSIISDYGKRNDVFSSRLVPIGDSMVHLLRSTEGASQVNKWDAESKTFKLLGTLPVSFDKIDRVVPLKNGAFAVLTVAISERAAVDTDIVRTIVNADGTLSTGAVVDFKGQGQESIVSLANLAGDDYLAVTWTQDDEAGTYSLSKVTDKGLDPLANKGIPRTSKVRPWVANSDVENAMVAVEESNSLKIWDADAGDAKKLDVGQGSILAFKADGENVAFLRRVPGSEESTEPSFDLQLVTHSSAENETMKTKISRFTYDSVGMAIKGGKSYVLTSTNSSLVLRIVASNGVVNTTKNLAQVCGERGYIIKDIIPIEGGYLAYGSVNAAPERSVWFYAFDSQGERLPGWTQCGPGPAIAGESTVAVWSGKRVLVANTTAYRADRDDTQMSIIPYSKTGETKFEDARRIDLNESYASPQAMLIKGEKLIVAGSYSVAHVPGTGAAESMILEFKVD